MCPTGTEADVTNKRRRVEYVNAKGRRQVSAEVPFELVDELDQIATDEDVARQTVILWALRDYVKKYPRIAQARALVG